MPCCGIVVVALVQLRRDPRDVESARPFTMLARELKAATGLLLDQLLVIARKPYFEIKNRRP